MVAIRPLPPSTAKDQPQTVGVAAAGLDGIAQVSIGHMDGAGDHAIAPPFRLFAEIHEQEFGAAGDIVGQGADVY